MDPENTLPDEATAAPVDAANETGSQPGTEAGSPTSGEVTEDTRTAGEIARDAFLEKYGTKDEPKASEPTPAEAPATTTEVTGTQTEQDPQDRVRLTDEEFKALPPRAQQRIGYLSAELRDAKRSADEATRQLEPMRASHEAFQALRHFADENGLQAEHINEALQVRAMVERGDYAGFLQAIGPLYEQAMRATGQAVSPEIQALVDAGEITPEAALRMSKTEAAAAAAEARAQRLQQQTEQAKAASAAEARKTAILAAARSTEATLRAQDPQFAQKQPAIQQAIAAIRASGVEVRDAQHAEQIVRQAYQAVSAAWDAATPKQPLKPTAPRPDASPATRMAPQPRNTAEAFLQSWGARSSK